MKIGLYADPHFSQSSSIVVGRRGEFTGRLNNLIESFRWMNQYFRDEEVDLIVCLGDLTDKPNLTSEEITAMALCELDDHYMILGNHCRSDRDGNINSLAIYRNVIVEPTLIADSQVLLLPYSKDLVDLDKYRPKIVLSHNDIKSYDFGRGYRSSEGYGIEEILDNCQLFINGHLHRGGWVVENRIMNLGCLSGMNFASCDGQWDPSIAILDTETLTVSLIENPKAYKFKKLEFDKSSKLKDYLFGLEKDNYVIQVRVPDTIAEISRKLIDKCDQVVASRVLTYHDRSKGKKEVKDIIKTDSRDVYAKLRDFISTQDPKCDLDKLNEIISTISVGEGS